MVASGPLKLVGIPETGQARLTQWLFAEIDAHLATKDALGALTADIVRLRA